MEQGSHRQGILKDCRQRARVTAGNLANRIAVLQQLGIWSPELPAVIIINLEAFRKFVEEGKKK